MNFGNTEINIDNQNMNFGNTEINIDIHFNFGSQPWLKVLKQYYNYTILVQLLKKNICILKP